MAKRKRKGECPRCDGELTYHARGDYWFCVECGWHGEHPVSAQEIDEFARLNPYYNI